jgi:hypothetical protein
MPSTVISLDDASMQVILLPILGRRQWWAKPQFGLKKVILFLIYSSAEGLRS